MKSTGHGRSKAWTVRAVAGAAMFVSLAAPVWSDEPATAGQAHAAPSAGASASRVSPEAQSAAARAPANQNTTTRPGVVCFQSSIQCFSTQARSGGPSTAAALDLRAPDVRKVFTQQELQQTLPDPDEQIATQETVQVEGQRQVTPVSVGLMAIPWAVMHPTQAWRILTPIAP